MRNRYFLFVLALPILQGSGFGAGTGCTAPPLPEHAKIEGRYAITFDDRLEARRQGSSTRSLLPNGGTLTLGHVDVHVDCTSPEVLCPQEVLVLEQGVMDVQSPAHREVEIALVVPSSACTDEQHACARGLPGTEIVRELVTLDENGIGRFEDTLEDRPEICVPAVHVEVNFDGSAPLPSSRVTRKTKFVHGTVQVTTPVGCLVPGEEISWGDVLVLSQTFEGDRE